MTLGGLIFLEEGRRKKEGLYIWILTPYQNSAFLGQGRKLLPSNLFLLPSLIKYLARRLFYVYY
jgi:hypothetical protein